MKHRLAILYLIFGALTVAVDQITFMALLRLLPKMTSIVPTVIAWIIAVNFAYITNRKWVFQSQTAGVRALLREAALFFTARIFSLLLTAGIMLLFVDIMGCNADLIKLASSVLVITLNFVLSKLWIFKGKKTSGT